MLTGGTPVAVIGSVQSRLLLSGLTLAAALASGADLSPGALAAWKEYVDGAHSAADQRFTSEKDFLWADEDFDRAARLRRGEVVVVPGTEHTPRRVPSGLIHHWMAAAFIPDSSIDRVIASLREYEKYREIYKPAVVESRALGTEGDEDRFSLRLINHSVLAKMAVDAEFGSWYSRAGNRACGIAMVKHLREIDDYGQKNQREMPEDQGSGYVWRMYLISRLEERDGGVYLETEVMALSRDIPASVQWLVSPMIRRVAKGALSALLEATRRAVLSSAPVEANRTCTANCEPKVLLISPAALRARPPLH